MTSYRPRRNKRKRRKSKLIFLLILLSIMLLGTVSFIVWRQFFYQPVINVQASIWGDRQEFEAAVIYNAELIPAPEGGLLHQSISHGEPVKSGQVIATVIDELQSTELQQQIDDIKSELGKYTIQNDGEGNEVITGETEAIRNQLRTLIYNYSLYRSFRDEKGMSKSFADLDSLVKDYYITQEASNQDQQRYLDLKEQLAVAEADYEHCLQEITASFNGMVSYQLDNLDQTLNPEGFPLEDYNWFDERLQISSFDEDSSVTVGQNIVKLIRKDKWWLIVNVPQKKSDIFLKATEFEIKIAEETYQAAYLYHNQEKRDLYFYFEIEEVPELFERFTTVELATEEIECMELPISAIEYESEKAYVYLKNGRTAEKTEVRVLRELIDTVLIEQLADTAEIIADVSQVRR